MHDVTSFLLFQMFAISEVLVIMQIITWKITDIWHQCMLKIASAVTDMISVISGHSPSHPLGGA